MATSFPPSTYRSTTPPPSQRMQHHASKRVYTSPTSVTKTPSDASATTQILRPRNIAGRSKSLANNNNPIPRGSGKPHHPLIGFDPLLDDASNSKKEKGAVWTGSDEDIDILDLQHPFLKNDNHPAFGKGSNVGKQQQSKPTHRKMNSVSELITSTKIGMQSKPRHRNTMSVDSSVMTATPKQVNKAVSHRNNESLDNSLRDIAHALSIEKPLTPPPSRMRITKILHPSGKQKYHKKAQTLDSFDLSKLMNHRDGVDDGNNVNILHTIANDNNCTNNIGAHHWSHTNASTSETGNSISTCDVTTFEQNSLLIPTLTPLKGNLTSSNKLSMQTSEGTTFEKESLLIPTLTPLKGYLTPSDKLSMQTSEQEPSRHQVEIPSGDEFLMHCRLCSLLKQGHQDFDFASLIGKSRLELNSRAVIQQHGPLVKSLLDCGVDVVLEGFFHGDSNGNDTDQRAEVAIFNCQSRRQFVVVFSGSSDQQNKPVRKRDKKKLEPKQLHSDQPVGVVSMFRDAYFDSSSTNLESNVFRFLDQLTERYPFCDVIMTGHSFGAALSSIAALRYASSRDMIRVSCHAFGSPKVGTPEFKQLVNSTPNLKCMRIEHNNDQFVTLPEGGSWAHVGHTISINNNEDKNPAVVAYRFDNHKPMQKSNFLSLPRSKNDKKAAHEVAAYVNSLEQFTEWVKNYSGEDGNGVRGTDKERRHMA